MAGQHDQYYDQEYRQLFGDHAFPGQAAEGDADEEGQHGNDDLLYDLQHDDLKLLKHLSDRPGLGPHGGKPQQRGQHQRRHHGHDLGNIQLESHLGQLPQAFRVRDDVQMGNDPKTCGTGHERRQYAGGVGEDHRHDQHPGGVVAQPGDGGRDEAEDDQRHAEGDQLAHDVF